MLLRVIAGPLCGAVLSQRGQQLEDNRKLAQSSGWVWCDMLCQRWKMRLSESLRSFFQEMLLILKRPKSLIEGTPTINSRKDQPGRSPYRWVVLKSEEMRTRFMPWCTCLSSQDVLIQSHHMNLGDRAVRQCETCWLQNTRCSCTLSFCQI